MAHFVIDQAEKRARRASLAVTNDYLHKEVSASRAIDRLKKIGTAQSLLFAGDVAIEQAWRDNASLASSWIHYAGEHLSSSIKRSQDETPDLSSRFRAHVKKAHLKPLKVMLGDGQLPDVRIVEPMYNKLVRIGKTYSQLEPEDFRQVSEDSRIEIAGTLGEVAVLLLGQRYALTNVGCNTWLPLQSRLSEDHGGDCLNITDEFTWDIGVYTHMQPEPIELPYKVQIKTSDPHSDTNTGDAPGESVLFIHPDLALYPGEKSIPKIIITSCFYEQDPSIDHERLTADLDARTEKMLDCFDR